MTLHEYLSEERGRAAFVARRVGLSPAFLAQLSDGSRPIPAARAAEIESATGGRVTRREMFPSNWWLIWPELVDDEHPIPQLAQQA